MSYLKATIAALILSAALTSPSFAADKFADWDINANGRIEANEFGTRFDKVGAFGRWDADRDGRLTESEFRNGVFATYDRDRNKVIEEPEYGDLGDDLGDGGFWDV